MKANNACLKSSLNGWLFSLGMLVYTLTRIYRVGEFPIYFFCDEAFFGVKVDELIAHGLHDSAGRLLPLFFEKAASRWVPQITLYLYLFPILLFGKSIEVIRVTSALSTCLAPLALGFFLKEVTRSKLWWLSPFILAVIPTWILHSRTAFETVQVVVAFSLFILAYGLYRVKSPIFSYAASLAATLTAYSHLSGLIIILCLSLLLFFSDFRYHLRQWRYCLGALLFGAVLSIPYIQFRVSEPGAVNQQLEVVDSVWFQRQLSMPQKAGAALNNFLAVANPDYWSGATAQTEIARHVWKSRGHIELWMWPFAIIGITSSLFSLKSAASRFILFATLTSLSPTLLVSPGLMRVFSFVIPFSILTILGFENILVAIKHFRLHALLSLMLAGLLSIHATRLLHEALNDSPTWSHDYGLYGMQWGARQIFEQMIPKFTQQFPSARLSISPNWANGANIFLLFFLTQAQRENITTGTIDEYLYRREELSSDHFFLMTAEEHTSMLSTQILQVADHEDILYRPDGAPGFFLVNLRYSENADQILQQKLLNRQKLVSQDCIVGSETLLLRHSLQDMGEVSAIFDADPRSLLRGLDANPFILEINFPTPRKINALELNLAGDKLEIKAQGLDSEKNVLIERHSVAPRVGELDALYDIDFGSDTASISVLRLEIYDPITLQDVHIHIRGIKILTPNNTSEINS